MTKPHLGLSRSLVFRRSIRHLAAALSGGVGGAYLILFFKVADAEAGLPENTYGAYLLLAVPYLVGAGLLLVLDKRTLWAIGVAVQIGVIGLFALFGAGLFGPGQGVFDYAALTSLRMTWWATGITGAEVVLLGLLGYLALTAAPAELQS